MAKKSKSSFFKRLCKNPAACGILSLIFIGCAFGFGIGKATVAFLIAAVLILPFKFIRAFFKRTLKLSATALVVIAIVLAAVGAALLPSDEMKSDPKNNSPGTEYTTEPTTGNNTETEPAAEEYTAEPVSINDIPAYSGEPYVVINGNEPEFSAEYKRGTGTFEKYSALDDLGRCGAAFACLGKDLMPTEERGEIGSVKPSGWQTAKYDFIDGKYLYNRCHLIGFQLAGENANKQNLVTGTRYMNTKGMLPFENMVADYIKETDMRVLYRVTPVFDGDELLCRGVQIEAYSVDDGGDGVCFNVFCYNVQPGVVIDYATGGNEAENN